MKNLLILTLCLFASGFLQAQTLTFEETVKYINGKIVCCSKNPTGIITATKSGEIKRGDQKVNLFDLVPDVTGLWTFHEDGVYICDSSCICFKLSAYDTWAFPCFNTFADAERVYKAMLHLRSLCTPVKDPFDD